ncbi:MAG: ATP phosphoribosyltransferase, partial [Synergistaceae bacterium]|nr:ATP phosphoribosyltransferase [Synergistaceae bacterium]
LSDVIFDIVQTGSTLKANGLVVIKEIMPVSMRLVSAAGTIHTRWNELKDIVAALRFAAEKQEA